MPSVAIDLVSSAVFELVDAQTLFPVGLGHLPTPAEGTEASLETLEDGAARIDPVYTPADPHLNRGWRGQADSMRQLWFEITGFGLTPAQAQRVSHLAYQVITERDEDGDFVHDLTIGGHTVMTRQWQANTPGLNPLGFGFAAGNVVSIVVHATA